MAVDMLSKGRGDRAALLQDRQFVSTPQDEATHKMAVSLAFRVALQSGQEQQMLEAVLEMGNKCTESQADLAKMSLQAGVFFNPSLSLVLGRQDPYCCRARSGAVATDAKHICTQQSAHQVCKLCAACLSFRCQASEAWVYLQVEVRVNMHLMTRCVLAELFPAVAVAAAKAASPERNRIFFK
jgi:hypothetical protein